MFLLTINLYEGKFQVFNVNSKYILQEEKIRPHVKKSSYPLLRGNQIPIINLLAKTYIHHLLNPTETDSHGCLSYKEGREKLREVDI